MAVLLNKVDINYSKAVVVPHATLKTATRWQRLSVNPMLQNRYLIMGKWLNIRKNLEKTINQSISNKNTQIHVSWSENSVNFTPGVNWLCFVFIEMRGPIQEMTRRNQTAEREQVPFVTVSRHEKVKSGHVSHYTHYKSLFNKVSDSLNITDVTDLFNLAPYTAS